MALLLTWLAVLTGAPQAHAAHAFTSRTSSADCDADLGEALVYPRGWGINPVEIEAMIRALPEVQTAMRSDLRFAQFIADESAPFFAMLGTYAGLGMTEATYRKRTGPGVPADAFSHRWYMVREIIRMAIDQGLYPASLGGERESLELAAILGPLPFAEPLILDGEFFARFGGEAEHVRLATRAKFKLRDLVMHSASAQYILLSLVPERFGVAPREAMLALRRRLSGVEGSETMPERRLMEMAMDALKQKQFSALDSAQRRLVLKGFEEQHAKQTFAYYFAKLRENYTKLTAEQRDEALLDSPLYHMITITGFMEHDTFIDQGLNRALERYFVENVFKAQVLPGPDLAERVKTRMRAHYRNMRSLWRELLRNEKMLAAAQDAPDIAHVEAASPIPAASPSVAPTPAAPSRAERLRLYAARMDGAQEKDAAPVPVAGDRASLGSRSTEGFSAAPALVAPSPEHAWWEDLADPSRGLRQARARLEAELKPNRIYVIPVRRTGYRYRVAFSERLIHQLLDPRGGEPEDHRAWLKALMLGPALAHGQHGWRKNLVPIDGLYFWEIKLRSSSYRILGNKVDGAWTFEVLQRTH